MDRMSIDIDKLSEAELIDLNHRIVERLRFMQQARAHMKMLQFRIGERVSFQSSSHGRVVGIVTRYNKKSVSLVTSDGGRWNVAPSLLKAEPEESKPSSAPGNVLQLPRR